jgi:hypothetical protein
MIKVTLIPFSYTGVSTTSFGEILLSRYLFFLALSFAFILFRFFIIKPPPIDWVDKESPVVSVSCLTLLPVLWQPWSG